MVRLIGPKCRICRAEGEKLFLKGARCESSKCPFNQGRGSNFIPSRPGAQFGRRRRRMTEYARQLREKQKLKRFYGTMERQFRRYYKKAAQIKGNVGVNLLTLLERRLDNVLYLSGLAASRAQARQYIRHGFLFSEGKRVTIPSYTVRQGEEFKMNLKTDGLKKQVGENLLLAKNRETPSWIDAGTVEKEHSFRVAGLPAREQISVAVEEQLVIELCSK